MKNIVYLKAIHSLKKHRLFLVFFLLSLFSIPRISHAQVLGGRLFSTSPTAAAPTFSYATPTEYEIAEITVSGSQFYDGNSMINISGLQVGDKIKVPGDMIASAIRKIMDQGILEEVEIYATKTEGTKIWLSIILKERPRLYAIQYTGVRKGEQESLNEKVKTYKGKIITETLRKNLELAIRKFYQEKGRLNIKTKSVIKTDTLRGNNATLMVNVVKGEKVKVNKIFLTGIEPEARSLILRKIKNTKQRRFGRIFKPSKFVPKKWDEDKEKLLAAMNKLGYRDFQVKSDSIARFDEESINLTINLTQGKKYYYRSISFEGNYIYPDSVLKDVIGIKKGDIYNTEELDKKMNQNPGEDLSSVYMDNGYLYYNAEPIETAIEGDSIDLTIRISEGKQATINKVILNGNTKTSDHVVMREIRTLPGQKFNKSAIIRTVRELSTIGYFNPEKISPNPMPRPDGTVDIEYNVEEKPSDQIELSGGWGGYIGFVGTLGVVFNNFSAKNLTNLSAWRPLPAGDGQKLSVRFQANGAAFQNYSLTFTEPWLGGKKPTSLSVSLSKSVSSNGLTGDERQEIQVSGLSLGIGKRLKNPDIRKKMSEKRLMWMRKNSKINVVLEGHADERGTREYNLALGERRANAAKDYLMTYGISSDRISVLSYGKERPVDSGSNPLAWSKNRRSVTVKAN